MPPAFALAATPSFLFHSAIISDVYDRHIIAIEQSLPITPYGVRVAVDSARPEIFMAMENHVQLAGRREHFCDSVFGRALATRFDPLFIAADFDALPFWHSARQRKTHRPVCFVLCDPYQLAFRAKMECRLPAE